MARPTLFKSNMNYHKSAGRSTEFCRLVWQNKAFLLKNRFRSYVRGFSTQANHYKPGERIGGIGKSILLSEHRAATKTTRHYNSRYFCDFKKIFQKTCHDHAGFVLCLLLFFLFFRQKDASGRPGPAKPLLLPGNDPKSFCKFFPKLLRSRLCGLLRGNSKILESINDFLKKQASKFLSFRGGLGEAPTIRCGISSKNVAQRC